MKILIVTFTTGVFLAFLLIHFFGASMIIYPMRVDVENGFLESKFGDHAIPVELIVKDSIRLSAYHINNPENKNGTFIICHGIGSCKEHQVGLVEWLDYLGYNSFLFDGRAHGKSEGDYCTYGYHEKKDISAIVAFLKEKNETPYIMGTSLGGAVALQALEYNPEIKGGIIMSTFSTMREVTLDYQKRLTKVGWKWIHNYVLSQAEELANFKVDDVSPETSCAQITQPVFIAHGKEDIHINYHCAERNYEALASESKELILIDDADHNNLWQKGNEELTRPLVRFIRENF